MNNVHSALQGVGDSSQGFANAILFIGFTQAIRWKLWRQTKRVFKRCCRRDGEQLLMSAVTENTPLLTDSSTVVGHIEANLNESCYEANASIN